MTPDPDPGPSRGALELIAVLLATVATFYVVWYALDFAQWLSDRA